MNKTLARAPAFALALLATAGAQAADSVQTLTSEDAAFELQWSTVPPALPFNALFEMHVSARFTGNAGAAAETRPIRLNVTATMPEHAHGMNTRAAVEALGDDRFIVRGLLFHMAGSWEIVFELAKGRVRDRATTRYELE
jgi:hypothetical protein